MTTRHHITSVTLAVLGAFSLFGGFCASAANPAPAAAAQSASSAASSSVTVAVATKAFVPIPIRKKWQTSRRCFARMAS